MRKKEKKKKPDDVFIAGDDQPLIPEGEYRVHCISHDIAYPYGRKTLFLHWKIIDEGKYFGVVPYQAINVAYRKFTMGTKFYQEWTKANGAPPKRGDRMSPRVFKNKIFSVIVKSVRSKTQITYSQVDIILTRHV